MLSSERRRHRRAVVEALALLALARFLVKKVLLSRWLESLGRSATLYGLPTGWDAEIRLDRNCRARHLATAVERAARWLPGESRCLPRAVTLQWLLRRRQIGSDLLIGVRPQQARGGIDDLHAWVVRDGEVLIGGINQLYYPIYLARTDRRSADDDPGRG